LGWIFVKEKIKKTKMSGFVKVNVYKDKMIIFKSMSIKCLICGKKFKFLGSHVRVHNITPTQYKEMFSLDYITSKELRENNSITHKGKPAWNKGLTVDDPRVAKYWETRRKHFPDNEPNKRAVKTKKKKYGHYCVRDQEDRSRKLSKASKTYLKRAWKTRHELYGPSGVRDPENCHYKNIFQKGDIPWNKGLTAEDDDRIYTWDVLTNKQKKDRLLRTLFKGHHRPNVSETKLLEYIKSLGFEYRGGSYDKSIAGHIPDYVHKIFPIIIEFDGDGGHNPDIPWVSGNQSELDDKRDEDYCNAGYRVIRIFPEDLMKGREFVIKKIQEKLNINDPKSYILNRVI